MARLAAGSSLPWRCLPYEERMELFYAAADLIVCRAGAMTVSEAAATGTPAVFVPLARVGQVGNADAMARSGGALVVMEEDAASVPGVAAGLLGDPDRLDAMAEAARGFGRPDAAGEIADRLLEVVDD
jgi:UDP-N-acetylglucosamine:LPS N-acetylglucosamine transferase